jgi:DNA-directed RNA polymerase subunit N (RpoN/RPB10)
MNIKCRHCGTTFSGVVMSTEAWEDYKIRLAEIEKHKAKLDRIVSWLQVQAPSFLRSTLLQGMAIERDPKADHYDNYKDFNTRVDDAVLERLKEVFVALGIDNA